jgi:hypothetical protein
MALAVRFEDGGREFELRPAGSGTSLPLLPDGFERVACAEGRLPPWPVVPGWLQRCDARHLRGLAEDADLGCGAGLPRAPQLHDAVLRLLGLRRLALCELMRRGRADPQQVESARVSSLTVTPSMLRAAPAPAPAPASPPAGPVTVAPVIDQDRQAAVLRRAAARGTPFCEECERR